MDFKDISKMKPGDRVRVSINKVSSRLKVHLVERSPLSFGGITTTCGMFYTARYIHPTTDPVTCKTCLRARRGK